MHRISIESGYEGPTFGTRFGLLIYPPISFFHSIRKLCRRGPMKDFADNVIIAVTATHSQRGVAFIDSLQTYTRDIFDNVDELVDADHFIAANVQRLDEVGLHQPLGALKAVVDIHEASGLLAIAPYFDLMIACHHRKRDFARNRSRSLLAPPVPRSERSIHVVIATDPRPQTKVFAEMAAHSFTEQLLPAVTVFRHCGIGVLLF